MMTMHSLTHSLRAQVEAAATASAAHAPSNRGEKVDRRAEGGRRIRRTRGDVRSARHKNRTEQSVMGSMATRTECAATEFGWKWAWIWM